MRMGLCRSVSIGEPANVVDAITCAILASEMRIPETTLSNPRESHVTLLRFYGMLEGDNREQMEFDLDQVRAEVEEDFFGDFDIGGQIAYLLPTEFSVRWGFLQVGNKWCRIMEIPVTYRIDDQAAFVK